MSPRHGTTKNGSPTSFSFFAIPISSSVASVNPAELFYTGYELGLDAIVPSSNLTSSFNPSLDNCEFYIYTKGKTILYSNPNFENYTVNFDGTKDERINLKEKTEEMIITRQKEKIAIMNENQNKVNDAYPAKYFAIKCASLLRETMWSMVSEITSKIDFDYKEYTNENLSKFNEEFKKLKS